MNRSQIANKLKGQIREFSGKLSEGLPKVAGRFLEEMVYGILCRQAVRVSEISRALNDPAPGGADQDGESVVSGTGETRVGGESHGQSD